MLLLFLSISNWRNFIYKLSMVMRSDKSNSARFLFYRSIFFSIDTATMLYMMYMYFMTKTRNTCYMVTLFIDKDNEIYILSTKVAIGLQPGKHLFGGQNRHPIGSVRYPIGSVYVLCLRRPTPVAPTHLSGVREPGMFRLRQRHFEGGAWRQGHFTFWWGWQHLHVLQIFIVLQSHAKKTKKHNFTSVFLRL